MIIISQFILHSTLAFHNKEPAIESSIVFLIRTHAYSCIFEAFRFDYRLEATVSSIETRYSIVNTREYRVSSVTLHLGGTVAR